MKTKDERRYDMWKRIIFETRGRIDRSNIMTVYLEQLNKVRLSAEIDEVLDAIIENEYNIQKYGKGAIR